MSRRYIFADESGNFDFSRKPGASKYFILTTVTADGFDAGQALLDLRRELAWHGVGLDREFHATTDSQKVRDYVFAVLGQHEFRVDATILQKSKAQPSIRTTDERFYKMAWYLHMKYLAPLVVTRDDELFVVGASIGTKKRRSAFHGAVADVLQQVSPTTRFRVASWDATSDPCLQVADYCCWAIQRKWENNDARNHVLIAGIIKSEFEAFRVGPVEYY
ncbi:MAG: DUF3800 domain-containing protein [Gemmatimonadaceae bacterium]